MKKNFFEIYVIWPNGYDKFIDICEDINNEIGLSIVYLKKKSYRSINKLIQSIYKYDNCPKFHLKYKLNYLKKYNNNYVIIICIRDKSLHSFKGSEKTRHLENHYVFETKQKIRNKYNLRYNDYQDHDHVIHGFDTQYKSLLYLNNNLRLNVNTILNRHKFKITNNHKKVINIDSLFCFNYQKSKIEKIKVQNSVQYQFLLGNKILYENYLKKYLGTHLNYWYSLNNFSDLYNSIKNNNLSKPIIINENFEILDGLHRCACLLALGYNQIHCYVI